MRAQLIESLAEVYREEATQLSSLSDILERAYVEASTHWSAFHVPQEVFVVRLADAISMFPPKKGLVDWFGHLQAPSLYLACGCALGDAVALSSFESSYGSVIDSVSRRFHKPSMSAEDLSQIIREKLLVIRESGTSKLDGYAGQGFLENWLRVTSTRICLDLVRVGAQEKREHGLPEDALHALPDEELDLELAFLKREYRDHFKVAFSEGLRHLSSSERNLLRQHLVSGLSLDQIGAMYHIHRATAARRLAKARQSLLDATRKALMEKLQISAQEFDSIMGLIQSRLDVSMHRLLAHASSVIEAQESA